MLLTEGEYWGGYVSERKVNPRDNIGNSWGHERFKIKVQLLQIQ